MHLSSNKYIAMLCAVRRKINTWLFGCTCVFSKYGSSEIMKHRLLKWLSARPTNSRTPATSKYTIINQQLTQCNHSSHWTMRTITRRLISHEQTHEQVLERRRRASSRARSSAKQTMRSNKYGKFSKFQVCFCGLDPGNLKFETVRTNKQRILFKDLRRSIWNYAIWNYENWA